MAVSGPRGAGPGGAQRAAAELGPVTQAVHTAGLSPVQAPAAAILRVDLLGTTLVLEEFGRVIAPRGAGAVIAGMAGYMLPSGALSAEQEQALAHTPADGLPGPPSIDAGTLGPQGACPLAILGPDATFVTGNDLLVDGGVVAALRSGRLGREARRRTSRVRHPARAAATAPDRPGGRRPSHDPQGPGGRRPPPASRRTRRPARRRRGRRPMAPPMPEDSFSGRPPSPGVPPGPLRVGCRC